MKPSPIQFGKMRIAEPCTVPEEEMLRHGQGQQFCNRCQTLVHDISGMEPRQIEALRRANGGKLCGAFYPTHPPLARNRHYRLLPSWLAGTAATLTLPWLLLWAREAQAANPRIPIGITQTPATGGPLQPSAECTTHRPDSLPVAAPLLLSSVILDQDSLNIPDSLLLQVTFPNGTQQEIVTNAGFFALKLEGMVAANESIVLSIAPQKFADYRGSRSYPAFRTHIKASTAQNHQIILQVKYVHNRMLRGDVR
jgi:hypothetical protein